MNSPSSPSASPIGARRAKRRGQVLQFPGRPRPFPRRPRQEWARKPHRGGGGLAVPGPFKRIARAGGQKVTIRIAQRRLFATSSSGPNYFLAGAVTTRNFL